MIAAAAMLVACAAKAPATALDGTSSESQQLIDNASKQQVLCRRQRVTVTRIAGVVCLTRAEWKEQRERADEVMREIRESEASREAMPTQPQPQPRNGP
jgi:hypothetical protein